MNWTLNKYTLLRWIGLTIMFLALLYQHLALRDAWADINSLSHELDRFHSAKVR